MRLGTGGWAVDARIDVIVRFDTVLL